ncbi:unnamed protein product [Linum trigynum]|uniref:Uncharacterized protein n=1 Tax=Linum trigynum TaxID=586398 RepID=A0AAV2GAI5_9ROSI
MYSSSHCIDMKIGGADGEFWRFTGIYGWPGSGQKERMWDIVRELATQWNGPWLCGGDFDEILSWEEKRGGPVREEKEMAAFHECLVETNLSDLGFHGYQYTWRIVGAIKVMLRSGSIGSLQRTIGPLVFRRIKYDAWTKRGRIIDRLFVTRRGMMMRNRGGVEVLNMTRFGLTTKKVRS